ncbi:MAG: threonylcarbamoyl-AMP synthase [Candidatus Latescibacteria bacterium]|nr:threonylcarbamoyl-AMP synthase [Candidatus Latescibacterota bacterium]
MNKKFKIQNSKLFDKYGVTTEIIKINPVRPSITAIKHAAKVIRAGGLVVLPTDTVYGLACDATNPEAVTKVFTVKQRPLSQPLSIAVSNYQDIYIYVKNFTETAKILAEKFLPGALTLILTKKKTIPDIVTAGRADIGIRIPDCKIVLKIIDYAQVPIVIPSANLHNKPSPVTAEQALEDLNGKADLVLDGGKTKYGRESTIVSCIGEKIKIVRPGVISDDKIKHTIKKSGLLN